VIALTLSTRLIDAIIAGVVIEGVALAAYRGLTGRGVRIPEAVTFLGAGLALLIALRLALSGAPRAAGGGALLAALELHVWHVAQHWNTEG
jgi:hypothetical protein